MLIYDDKFTWEGWGGKLRLASGECRLRVYDLQAGRATGIQYLKPVIAIAADVPESGISIKSCAGNIATKIINRFEIAPHRMIYLEYYPATRYGKGLERIIAEKYERVEFTWHHGKAISPKWRELRPPLLDMVKSLGRKIPLP